ncbi:type IV secretion system protein VirB10 [Phenylobacterium kunshanense]|uniref:Type IV secretion system protein VirB10 n=1 Tax=Phenylobacterium kunshanense TaxID=1445034 RepID=A0A328BFY4_9CAUL|nr:type IV secretion system protein VirB10 [Phenylobacterium kunshanense]RAK66402.1 type IV secretion system protein VirB10 [Phenylobacterium kunshanense]
MTDVPTASSPDTDPPLDRTISPIAGPLSSGGRGKALAFAGLLVGCGAVALATWSAEQPRPERKRETPARQVVAFEPAKSPPPTLAQPGAGSPSLTKPGGGDIVPAIEGSTTEASTPTTRTGSVSPREAARRSPLMAYSRGGGLSLAGGAPALIPALAPDRAATELDDLRRGSTIGRATAAPVGDRNFLVLAGATIPCVLQTAIDTTTAGYVTCLIDRDVYSDNGAVVLLEKGARVLGEYRTGMRQGQARVFVLWTRAVTPNGVAISLASPASDALGRAGFGGTVDTHFWDRFGAAILLSIIDGGAAALADDGAVGTVRLPSDAAGLAVRQGDDIRPTLRKDQGSEVAIQVAQDLDFSSVYALRPRP